MIDIKPNLAEAVAFAVSLPTDQAHLCAIHPAGNRPVVGQSFPKTDSGQAAALRWLPEINRGINNALTTCSKSCVAIERLFAVFMQVRARWVTGALWRRDNAK